MEDNNCTNNMIKLDQSADEQDQRIFGLLHSEIADALANFVSEAIVESVASLPLVTDKEKVQALTRLIQGASMRSIDIMEAYSGRNIFTLRRYPRHRRLRILCEGRMASSPPKKTRNSERIHNNFYPVEKGQQLSISLPTKSEITSLKEMNELEDELLKLKEKLNAARLLRNDLVSQYQGLESAFVASNTAVSSLSEVSSEGVLTPVKQVVSRGTYLRDLSKDCKEMIHQLGVTKQLRSSQEENDEIPTALKNTKRKRLAMEEEYIIDRKVLQSKNVASLNVLRGILKPK